MPNDPSVYVRFMWYLRLLTYNGFVVVPDNHLNADPTIVADAGLWLKVDFATECRTITNHTVSACLSITPKPRDTCVTNRFIASKFCTPAYLFECWCLLSYEVKDTGYRSGRES